jgi:hypothetical protein
MVRQPDLDPKKGGSGADEEAPGVYPPTPFDASPSLPKPGITHDQDAIEGTSEQSQHAIHEAKEAVEQDFPYCIMSERRKIFLVLLVSFAAIISPISSSIYFPAVNDLSRELNVSITLIDLTISTYLVRISSPKAHSLNNSY